jgi:predicted MPP superfamily phosphohydrolase
VWYVFGASLLLFAAVGHGALWLDVFRRVAASNVPCWAVRFVERLVLLVIFLVPVVLWNHGSIPYHDPQGIRRAALNPAEFFTLHAVAWDYIFVCAALGAWRMLRWGWRTAIGPAPDRACIQCSVERLADRPTQLAATLPARVWLALPFNEATQVEFNVKEIYLPAMSDALDGLKLLHLSDLHVARHWKPAFFHNLFTRMADLSVDVAVLTGDILEHAECLEWLRLLETIRPRWGAYFVLGNHDKRLSCVPQLRRLLENAGWTWVGGQVRWDRWRDTDVVIAGNERPWFEAPDMAPLGNVSAGLKLALLHTPDQFRWALEAGFDMVLAGHTHGGQIQIPKIGPLFVPCHCGTRYAEGVFAEGQTRLHVSRGVSSLHLVRFRCRPEVSTLVLRASKNDSANTQMCQS